MAIPLPGEAGTRTYDEPSKKEEGVRARQKAAEDLKAKIQAKKREKSGQVEETLFDPTDLIGPLKMVGGAILGKLGASAAKAAVLPISMAGFKWLNRKLVQEGKEVGLETAVGIVNTPTYLRNLSKKLGVAAGDLDAALTRQIEEAIAKEEGRFTTNMRALFERTKGTTTRTGGEKAPITTSKRIVAAPNEEELRRITEKILMSAKSGDEEAVLFVTQLGNNITGREAAEIVGRETEILRNVTRKGKSGKVTPIEEGVEAGIVKTPIADDLLGYNEVKTLFSEGKEITIRADKAAEALAKAEKGGADPRIVASLRQRSNNLNSMRDRIARSYKEKIEALAEQNEVEPEVMEKYILKQFETPEDSLL